MKRVNRLRSLLVDSMRAHTLKFATSLAPTYGDAVGIRILVVFLAVGVGVFLLLRFGADAADVRGLPVTNLVFVSLLAANTVFTFGPLHFNYLVDPGGVRWGDLAAVFGIGLFFGIIYRRSGNLWIPAVLHGLWPPNMT